MNELTNALDVLNSNPPPVRSIADLNARIFALEKGMGIKVSLPTMNTQRAYNRLARLENELKLRGKATPPPSPAVTAPPAPAPAASVPAWNPPAAAGPQSPAPAITLGALEHMHALVFGRDGTQELMESRAAWNFVTPEYVAADEAFQKIEHEIHHAHRTPAFVAASERRAIARRKMDQARAGTDSDKLRRLGADFLPSKSPCPAWIFRPLVSRSRNTA